MNAGDGALMGKQGRYALVITADGFRILDKHGCTRHVVHLPKRLRRLLLAAWACGWAAQNHPLERGDDDPGLNAPVNPSFAISSLRRLLGKSANRTDHCTLRKYLRRADGPCLISEGRSRMSLVDFGVDTAGKAPGETLKAYLYRVLAEHDIRVPEGPTG
ncbi:MAG: hypothetical protein NTW87_04315 [Planctomycetota bacterium]|nr:hypothetical protein [Planctomycetota bacterium]